MMYVQTGQWCGGGRRELTASIACVRLARAASHILGRLLQVLLLVWRYVKVIVRVVVQVVTLSNAVATGKWQVVERLTFFFEHHN